MMNTSAKLAAQLQNVLNGNAWYGNSVCTILDVVSFEAAYERQPGASHTIAAIVLHMLAWTEEAIKRMQGKKAADPIRGDWPDPGTPEEQKWAQLVDYFKLANVELMNR